MDRIKAFFLMFFVAGSMVFPFMLRYVSSLRNRSLTNHFSGATHEATDATATKTNRTWTTPMSMNVPAMERSGAETQQRSGRCRYKIQIFDVPGLLPETMFQNVFKQALQKTNVRTNVPCADYACDVELTRLPGLGHLDIDAVVFRLFAHLIPSPIPKADMNPKQAWIYFSWESPRYNAIEDRHFGDLPVHATWTYSRVSEARYPYGLYKPGQPMVNHTRSIEDWLKGKTKLVAWMASNCIDTFWPRLQFVTELKKHIPVDAYGKCGNLTCRPVGSRECDVDLVRQYKFYLAIENAECNDYITEKAWQKPLLQGVVPIVYGPQRRIYEELLPPNSFIFLGDFKSAKELANYLRLLDSKSNLYVKYLEWQYKGSVEWFAVGDRQTRVCSLIPVIEQVKRGELKRAPVKTTKFYRSCREGGKTQNSSFGVGNWSPW